MRNLLLPLVLLPLTISSQPVIDTVTGDGTPGYTGDGGVATSAQLNLPRGVGFDAAGNLLIADYANHVIRRVDRATGAIATVAGDGLQGDAGDGGQATAARLNFPVAVVGAADGSIYIADQFNHKVRHMAPDGTISTVVGTGLPGYNGDGMPGTLAMIDRPSGLALDADGNLLIADFGNSRIRLLDTTGGTLTTFAGSAVAGYAGDGGAAVAAELFGPFDVDVDSAGNVFIADNNNHAVRRVDRVSGVITTVVGNGQQGAGGDGALARHAQVNFTGGVAIDSRDNLYVADHLNTVIRRVDAVTGIIERFAGSGVAGSSGDGGDALLATMQFPWDIAMSPFGELHIAVEQSHRIRMVSADLLPENVPASPVVGDQLGASVAVEGTLMAVGVPAASGAGANSGQVLVYELRSDQTVLVDTIDVPDGFFATRFGTAVAIRNGDILIGAQTNPAAKVATTPLRAALMERLGQSWQLKVPLVPAEGSDDDQFGASVAFAGDLIAVGAPGDGDMTARPGAAHVFAISGNTVVAQAAVRPPGLPDNGKFGSALAGQDGRLAIGASGLGQAIAGSVTLVTMISDNLNMLQTSAPLQSPSTAPMDGFGAALALDGDRLLVGSPGADDDRGAAFVFDITANATALGRLGGADHSGARFGSSVAFAGGDIVAGAPGSQGGAVFVFDSSLNRRQIIEAPPGATDFGASVAGSAALLLTGAPTTATDAGAAFVQRRDSGVLFVGNFE